MQNRLRITIRDIPASEALEAHIRDKVGKLESFFDHIISWLPEGDGFRILDANAFARDVMPKYFSMKYFKSFQRQLSLYSFKRETEGRKRGMHELSQHFFLVRQPGVF